MPEAIWAMMAGCLAQEDFLEVAMSRLAIFEVAIEVDQSGLSGL